jgi:hypothetical protein
MMKRKRRKQDRRKVGKVYRSEGEKERKEE